MCVQMRGALMEGNVNEEMMCAQIERSGGEGGEYA